VKRILIASLLAVGCTADTEPADYAEGLGTPENPIPSEESYALVSHVRLSLALPAVDRAVANVRAFSENPGRALLARPGGAELLAAVPSAVRNSVEGYINTELDKLRIASKTLRVYAGDLSRFAQDVLGEVVIDSSLSISAEGAVHSLVDLSFTPGDIDVIVPIGGLAADALVQRPTADVAAAGALALGEHRFGLGFGAHAWQAINLASMQRYGADVSIFTSVVNCGALAQVVAAKCVSGTCVGHAQDIAAICTNGLAGTIGELGMQLASVKLSAMRFVHGSARLVDSTGDGIADRIVDGSWDAQTDVGAGPVAATATFATE